MKILHRIVLTCLLLSFVFAARAQEFLKLQGRILSAETKEPVPYAAIGFPEKGLGTVCDENGNFELKVPHNYKNLHVCVSALGFKQNCRPVSGFSAANPTVLLEPANLELATVEIKVLSAAELVKEAIRRIPENYADNPVRYTYYQRDSKILNDRPAYIIEAVNEAYRNYAKKDYQLSILKSRGMATSVKGKELMNNTWVSVYPIISYDNIQNSPDYLNTRKLQNFDYQLLNETLIGKDTVYEISFSPKPKKNGQENPGIEGKLYIHKRSYAVMRLESKENKASIDQENNSLSAKATNKACKCILTYQGGILQTNYKQVGNRWYFSNAYNEGHSITTGEKYSKPETSTGILQIVATNIQTENAQQIPENQRVKSFRNLYSKAPKDINEQFWQQYNVLPLPDAYKKVQEKTVGL